MVSFPVRRRSATEARVRQSRTVRWKGRHARSQVATRGVQRGVAFRHMPVEALVVVTLAVHTGGATAGAKLEALGVLEAPAALQAEQPSEPSGLLNRTPTDGVDALIGVARGHVSQPALVGGLHALPLPNDVPGLAGDRRHRWGGAGVGVFGIPVCLLVARLSDVTTHML